MKSFIKWFLFMLCLFLVQTCAKVYFKAKRIEKEKVTKVDNTTYEYRDNTSELKRKIGNNLDDADVLEKMSTTTDIDEKLRILTYNMNKNLPLNLGDMVLSKVEQLENREIRYRYIMLGDVSAISNTQWDNYKEYFLNKIKYSDDFKAFKKYLVTMSYAYYDANGKLLNLIKIMPDDYR